jgi:hypothetical protein
LVFPYFLFLIFDPLCKRFSSSSCIDSAIVTLFIKRGESLFHGVVSSSDAGVAGGPSLGYNISTSRFMSLPIRLVPSESPIDFLQPFLGLAGYEASSPPQGCLHVHVLAASFYVVQGNSRQQVRNLIRLLTLFLSPVIRAPSLQVASIFPQLPFPMMRFTCDHPCDPKKRNDPPI